jgi:tetratricopeptide (TPR) repeat protein
MSDSLALRLGGLSLGLLALVAGCADSDPVDDEGPPAASVQSEEAEFSRRLRLGVDQLRRFLPGSAQAEFERCASMRPDDPELLFHLARLELMPGGGGPSAAIPLLERVVEVKPDSVKAHRLLYELKVGGDESAAKAHQAAIAVAYGQVGLLELASHAAYLAQGQEPYLRFVKEVPGARYLGEYRALKTALLQLNRDGEFAPSEAVPVIEQMLRQFPDLTVVRMYYAKKLVLGEIRVNYSDRPDLPPMSSTLILDTAQLHYEQVFDQLNPGSLMAMDALYMLGRAALLMGDYDDSVAYLDIQLAMPYFPQAYRRFLLGRRGLARYKQKRYDEAIDLLRRSLEDPDNPTPIEVRFQWILHLAYEAAETPQDQRRDTFVLNNDLLHPPGHVAFDFEDVAPRLRIDKRDGVGPSAWGDYDRDGDFDLFVTGADSYGILYRNDGEIFSDVSQEAKLFHVHSGFSATFADYNADGWPDLHIGRDGWSGPMRNSLYRNNGDGTFTEVTEHAGVGNPGSSFVCTWSDFDRDGDVDLMVANGITGGGDTNTLYRNNGDGTFTDVTERAGLAEPAGTKTIGLAFGDYDLDGWPDLFVSGFGTTNRLYRNNGDGTFVEVASQVGVAGADDISLGYVAFFMDFDNDSDLDILRTSLAPWNHVLAGLSDRFDSLPAVHRPEMLQHCPKLYRNNGDGTFTEIGEQAGFVYPIGIMGAGVADLDNDGYLDVYFGTGDPGIERMEPDRFWRNNGDQTFTDVTFPAGLGNVGKGHGVTFMDIDGDGDLEIYAPEGGFVHGDAWPNALYLNRQKSDNHWLHVDLEGRESNRDAVDTKLIVRAGELRYLREVHNGEGFGSSNTPTVELGLGRMQRIDRLEVRWPSGRVQIFDDLPIDSRIFLREGERWRLWDGKRNGRGM